MMGRFWFGLVTLLVLLALGLWVATAMNAVHQPMADLLERAAEAALEEDWATAEGLAMQAKGSWERHWRLTAAVADHSPMDELDGLFAQLPVFIREREVTHFASTCAQLAQLAQAMGDAHSLSWWNLL